VPPTQPDVDATGDYQTPGAALPEPTQADINAGLPAVPSSIDDLPETDDGDAAGAVTDPELPRGARVRDFGDYEVHRVLGRGGMGIVTRPGNAASTASSR
jgi:hypothetical protein